MKIGTLFEQYKDPNPTFADKAKFHAKSVGLAMIHPGAFSGSLSTRLKLKKQVIEYAKKHNLTYSEAKKKMNETMEKDNEKIKKKNAHIIAKNKEKHPYAFWKWRSGTTQPRWSTKWV